MRPLRSLIGLAVFCFALSAPAQPLSQPNHHRALFLGTGFFDSKGFAITSTFDSRINQVRFDSCDRENNCKEMARIDYDKLEDRFQEPLLEVLRSYRAQAARKIDSSFWVFLSGGSERDRDLKLLDKTIADIERLGLKNWILLREETFKEEPPAFVSLPVYQGLADRLEVFFSGQGESHCETGPKPGLFGL